MVNSFFDGTKSALEIAAISITAVLMVPRDGLLFAPIVTQNLTEIMKPSAQGGILDQAVVGEVVSCLERDGPQLHWGAYITLEVSNDEGRCADYVRRIRCHNRQVRSLCHPCRLSHLIGFALGISVASTAIRDKLGERTHGLVFDGVAVAKLALKLGQIDGRRRRLHRVGPHCTRGA